MQTVTMVKVLTIFTSLQSKLIMNEFKEAPVGTRQK